MPTRQMQEFLRDEGLYHGPITGDEDRLTIRALQRFLARGGHYRGRLDGVRGRKTRKAEEAYTRVE